MVQVSSLVSVSTVVILHIRELLVVLLAGRISEPGEAGNETCYDSNVIDDAELP